MVCLTLYLTKRRPNLQHVFYKYNVEENISKSMLKILKSIIKILNLQAHKKILKFTINTNSLLKTFLYEVQYCSYKIKKILNWLVFHKLDNLRNKYWIKHFSENFWIRDLFDKKYIKGNDTKKVFDHRCWHSFSIENKYVYLLVYYFNYAGTTPQKLMHGIPTWNFKFSWILT